MRDVRRIDTRFNPTLFAVYAHPGCPAFEILRRAKRGDAFSVSGVVKVHVFSDKGTLKAAIDIIASLLTPLGESLAPARSASVSPMKELIRKLK